MRLLNTKTLQLHEFHSNFPLYAILSHTWVDGEEVAFEDIETPDREEKAGFRKIKRCCSQAASDGFEFVWVDTCCIDKRSSAELSEAINSMYRWYENARICYAYLPDVKDREHPESEFAKSRWFTRGWTLQELVAPSDVVFFGGEDWFKIGTKASLRDAISRITKIDTSILKCSQDVFKASIAQRMSWASKRKTTRPEDIAYCLLGIFKVNMPLLYGEGENAFMRLQSELLNVSNDHTIFAWSMAGSNESPEPIPPTSGLYKGIYDSSLGSSLGGLGLLASSVVEFSNCGNIRQSQENSSSSHYMTNIGLCITLPTVLVRKRASTEYYAFLDCYRAGPDISKESLWRICLSLRHEGNSRFYRFSIGERLLKERHYWARMTPMFITRTRSDRSLSGSVIHAGSRPKDPPSSKQNLRLWPDDISWVRWLMCALHKVWSSHGDRETLDDETTPLLCDADRGLQDPPNSNHHEQILRFWQCVRRRAQWLMCVLQNILSFLASNGVKLLIPFVPLGIFAGAVCLDPTTVFVLNFLAIMALAQLLSVATKELSAKLEYTLGRLINAIFGNAVETIVSIAALKIGEVDIIQWSIMGSITSNMLLVLGCCFCVSGMLQLEQTLNFTAASTMLSLMAVALASLILPATLYTVLQKSAADTKDAILGLSRGVAIVLLILFFIYLYFQQKSPANFFDVEQCEGEDAEDSPEELVSNPLTVVLALLLIIVVMAICADNLVGSIDSIIEMTHVTKGFIGFVILPAVSNTAGPATAVIAAYKNKLDLAIDIVIGSIMQITLFVMPFAVMLGWVINQPMQLEFGFLETLCFFLGVFVVNLLVQGGKINYLGGVICVAIYFMIALTIYFYPDDLQVWPGDPSRS